MKPAGFVISLFSLIVTNKQGLILFMMPYDRELIAQLFKYPVYLLLLFFSYICKFL